MVDAKTASVGCGNPPRMDIPSAAHSAANQRNWNPSRSLRTASQASGIHATAIMAPMCSARDAKYPPVSKMIAPVHAAARPAFNFALPQAATFESPTDSPYGEVYLAYRWPSFKASNYATGLVLSEALGSQRAALFGMGMEGTALYGQRQRLGTRTQDPQLYFGSGRSI